MRLSTLTRDNLLPVFVSEGKCVSLLVLEFFGRNKVSGGSALGIYVPLDIILGDVI